MKPDFQETVKSPFESRETVLLECTRVSSSFSTPAPVAPASDAPDAPAPAPVAPVPSLPTGFVKNASIVLGAFCQSQGLKFSRDFGYAEIIAPLFLGDWSRGRIYNAFYVIASKYCPKSDQLDHLSANLPYSSY